MMQDLNQTTQVAKPVKDAVGLSRPPHLVLVHIQLNASVLVLIIGFISRGPICPRARLRVKQLEIPKLLLVRGLSVLQNICLIL